MALTLENIKGGGGSIKLGAVGTIGALMTRELESISSVPQKQPNPITGLQTRPVSVPCGATPRRLQGRRSLDQASSSNAIFKETNFPIPEAPRKSKGYAISSRQVSMLGSDKISVDRTPCREKRNKKGLQLVDIVDIKCGDPHKSWANPVTNRFKKLGFTKLSETVG